MGAVVPLRDARLLSEARTLLASVGHSAPVIWKRRLHRYYNHLDRDLTVEVMADLSIRVLDPRTREVLAQSAAPAPAPVLTVAPREAARG